MILNHKPCYLEFLLYLFFEFVVENFKFIFEVCLNFHGPSKAVFYLPILDADNGVVNFS